MTKSKLSKASLTLHNTPSHSPKGDRERDNLFRGREIERERVSQWFTPQEAESRQADRQQVVERIGGLSLVFASQVDLPPHQQ